MSASADDWRRLCAPDGLQGAYLDPVDTDEIRRHRSDMTHCAFCLRELPKYQFACAAERSFGGAPWYVPEDKSCAVCEDCFADFREEYGWHLLDGWDIEWGDGETNSGGTA